MLRIAICDDNIMFAQQALCAVEKIMQTHNVEYSATTFESGHRLIEAGFFDIILLDIEMNEINGIETAQRLRQQKNNSRIIFLTSHKEYVFSAFDVAASHYLLKPIDTEKLGTVLMRLVNELTAEKEQCCTVKCGTEVHRVPLAQIQFVEIFGRKISLHTQNKIFTFNGRLEELEQSLPQSFFRCHKSYIINLAHVVNYDKETAVLQSGERVPIARRKFSEFGKAFLAYLCEKGDA